MGRWKVTTMIKHDGHIYYPSNVMEGETWEQAWNEFLRKHSEHEYVSDVQLYGNIAAIEQAFLKQITETRDFDRVSKIIKAYRAGKFHCCSFAEDMRRITRNVTSDHSIKRYQCLGEWFYTQLNEME